MSPLTKARLTWHQRICAFTVAALACLFVSATPAYAAAPTNDNFADATEITQLPFSETVDASEASIEPGEEPSCNGGVTSVWYRFTPDRDMSVKAEANDNVTYRTVALALYAGTSLDNLTLLACGTQSPLGYFSPQLVDFDATAGTTYYIRASDFGGVPVGTFTFDVEELIRPANDDMSNAQPVGNLPASVSGDTTNATLEPGEQQPCGGITGSVWYSVTTATATDLWVPPTVTAAVYDAGGALVGCGGAFRTVAGTTYLIQVLSYPTPGPFTLEVRTYTPITGSVSVDSHAKIDRFGKVTVSGSVRCTGDFAIGYNVSVTLQQKAGKQPMAEGYGFAYVYTPGQAVCDGRPHAWTATVNGSQTSAAFWTGSMTATPVATIITDPYNFQVDVSGPSSKVAAQREK